MPELARQVWDGSLEMDAAVSAARTLGSRREVSAQQLAGMADAAFNLARTGDWRHALTVAELPYEAAVAAHDVQPDDGFLTEAWLLTAGDLVEVLHRGLFEAGDIRLYARAMTVGDAAIAGAEQAGLRSVKAELSHRLGALLLDVYTANRSPTNYKAQFDAWVARALQSDDPELRWLAAGSVGNGDEQASGAPTWPAPLEGLKRAEALLRAALASLPAGGRGATAKALVQLLEWRAALGGEREDDELRRMSELALEELDPDDAQARMAVMSALERLGDATEPEQLVRLLEDEWAGYLAANDQLTAWDAASQAATALQQRDPVRALALLDRQRELASVWSDESMRKRHFEVELQLFARAYAPEGMGTPPDGDLDAAARRALDMAQRADSPHSSRDAAAALIQVMTDSVRCDRERLGLSLMDAFSPLDCSLWAERGEALDYLVAGLIQGEGVNRMRARSFDDAASYYRKATEAYARLAMSVPMVESISYIDDTLLLGASELNELTAWLAAKALELELLAPSGAPPVILRLAAHLLAAQASAGTSPEVVQLLLAISKSRRFAAQLAQGTSGLSFDEQMLELLELEAAAEAELPVDSDILRPMPFGAGLGEDDLITAWVHEYEKGPSETLPDRVANLQRAAERHLSGVLTPSASAPIAMLDHVRRRLDERTALLQLFEGAWTDGALAFWQLLVTKDIAEVAVGREAMPYGTVQASYQGRAVTMPQSGFYVGELRRALQADPGPLEVAAEAEAKLAEAYPRYLQAVDNCRERLQAAGIERLMVVPHGPSHYLPVHLLGPPGKPLAGDWTVTYLSSVAELTVVPAPTARRTKVGVFGLSYADQPRLPQLDDSAEEARAIAESCGATPMLDEAATESAFRQALETCRWVHVRAHGRLYVDAPSFHTVFLHPSAQHDGRLRAYEILPLDLIGLELVTLGACETALGRVDRSDNPRGLPAALMLAGARSVIGTLWPALASASTCFFTRLYASLMESDGDVIASFASAQRDTRERFPQYRDWGAFYLVGAP